MTDKMTAMAFDKLAARLPRVTCDTAMIARAVLVDGERQTDVATRHGMTRQRVSAIIRRFQQARDEVPADWRHVDVWLPPDWASKVAEIARTAARAE